MYYEGQQLNICNFVVSLFPFTTSFEKMNATDSGMVTLWEFREYFNLPDDRSTTRLFRCFDEDRDNRIGFLELVVGLWTYCECESSVPCGTITEAIDAKKAMYVSPPLFSLAIDAGATLLRVCSYQVCMRLQFRGLKPLALRAGENTCYSLLFCV